MSREGWIVAVGACLLLLVVPYAMYAGFRTDDSAANQRRQRPPDDSAESGDWAPEETSEPADPEDDSDDENDGEEAPLPDTRTVTGEVTDSAGKAIAGAEVGLVDAADGVVATGDDGAFSIAEVPEDAFELEVTAFGYDATVVDVARGTESVEVVMPPANNVTGTVLDGEGHAVAGASVKCLSGGSGTARTAGAGRFTLAAGAAGCMARATHPRYGPSPLVAMDLGPGNVLLVRDLARISGVVHDSEDKPYRGFVLSLHSFEPEDGRSKMRPYRQTFAHPKGKFEVSQLPAGTYVFTVALRGRSGVETHPIQVKSGQRRTGVRIVID